MTTSQWRAWTSVARCGIGLALVAGVAAGCRQPGERVSRPARLDTGRVSDGYTERASTEAGGAQAVSFDDESRNKVSRVEELIAARFAGVQVTRTSGGGYTIRIRGAGSFMSGEEPLILVDGVPVTGGLGWVNPADVSRIVVLKNPQETAIYGVRGANGVIVITTNRPK